VGVNIGVHFGLPASTSNPIVCTAVLLLPFRAGSGVVADTINA
jgi:hypothetical protein